LSSPETAAWPISCVIPSTPALCTDSPNTPTLALDNPWTPSPANDWPTTPVPFVEVPVTPKPPPLLVSIPSTPLWPFPLVEIEVVVSPVKAPPTVTVLPSLAAAGAADTTRLVAMPAPAATAPAMRARREWGVPSGPASLASTGRNGSFRVLFQATEASFTSLPGTSPGHADID